MSRIFVLLAALVAVSIPLTASAVAAPGSSSSHAKKEDDVAASDDPTRADDPASEADPSAIEEGDDPSADDPEALAELCGLVAEDDPSAEEEGDDPSAKEEADDPSTLGEVAADLGSEVGGDLGEISLDPSEGDDPTTGDDPDELIDLDAFCAELAENAAAAAEAAVPTVKKLLKSGKVETPAITVNGPATIRQELWIPAPTGGHSIRAAGSKGKAPAKKKVTKKSHAAKKAGPILAGRAVKVVTRKGDVRLTIRLNSAARKILKAAKRNVTFTVKTTTTAKGSKVAKKKVSSLVVKLK